MERRLAAILATDVVGYSRLMGADEQNTLDRLHECRQTIDQHAALTSSRAVMGRSIGAAARSLGLDEDAGDVGKGGSDVPLQP